MSPAARLGHATMARRLMAKTLTLTCLVAAGVLLLAARPAAARHRSRAKHASPESRDAPTKKQARAKKPAPPKTFPSSCEVDQFLGDTLSMSPRERLPAAIALMNRMLNAPAPHDRDPIWLWEYFLQRWAALFRARGEMDVLEAADETPPDARFSLSECALFYREVLQDTRAVEYYRYRSKRGRLAICFEPDELERRLALPVEGVHDRGHFLTRVTACEADELIATLAQEGPRARRIQELIARSNVDEGDPAGASYLLTRLAAQFGAHPDEAILAGFDAAVRGTPPEKRACELYASTTQSKAACAAFKQHYKDLTSIPGRCVTDGVKRCLEK